MRLTRLGSKREPDLNRKTGGACSQCASNLSESQSHRKSDLINPTRFSNLSSAMIRITGTAIALHRFDYDRGHCVSRRGATGALAGVPDGTIAEGYGSGNMSGTSGTQSPLRRRIGGTGFGCKGGSKAAIKLSLIWFGLVSGLGSVHQGNAQSIDPMLGKIATSRDFFSVRVKPGNPYKKRMKMFVGVYDHEFRPIKAYVTPQNFLVRAMDTRTVLVKIPFEGRTSRKIRICAETYPFGARTGSMRTRVCGKFLGIRK